MIQKALKKNCPNFEYRIQWSWNFPRIIVKTRAFSVDCQSDRTQHEYIRKSYIILVNSEFILFMLKYIKKKNMKLLEKRRCTQNVTYVIFDLDGTILDTESVYRKAYRKVFFSLDSHDIF